MSNPMQPYINEARKAISNPVLQGALANLQDRLGKVAAAAYLNLAEGPDLRLKAHELCMPVDQQPERAAGNPGC